VTDLLLALGYSTLSLASATAVLLGSWLVGVAALIGGVLLAAEILRNTRGG
jgi:hypothetical protein